MNAVNCVDTLENVFNGIVNRILARFNCKALVTHILKGNDLCTHLLLSELLSCNVLILKMIRTVNAAVYTVI